MVVLSDIIGVKLKHETTMKMWIDHDLYVVHLQFLNSKLLKLMESARAIEI